MFGFLPLLLTRARLDLPSPEAGVTILLSVAPIRPIRHTIVLPFGSRSNQQDCDREAFGRDIEQVNVSRYPIDGHADEAGDRFGHDRETNDVGQERLGDATGSEQRCDAESTEHPQIHGSVLAESVRSGNLIANSFRRRVWGNERSRLCTKSNERLLPLCDRAGLAPSPSRRGLG